MYSAVNGVHSLITHLSTSGQLMTQTEWHGKVDCRFSDGQANGGQGERQVNTTRELINRQDKLAESTWTRMVNGYTREKECHNEQSSRTGDHTVHLPCLDMI